MQQSKTIFFGIIGLAVVVVVGMAIVGSFLTDSLDLPTNSGEIEIQIVVAPAIKPWVDQAAREFVGLAGCQDRIGIPADQLKVENEAVGQPWRGQSEA